MRRAAEANGPNALALAPFAHAGGDARVAQAAAASGCVRVRVLGAATLRAAMELHTGAGGARVFATWREADAVWARQCPL